MKNQFEILAKIIKEATLLGLKYDIIVEEDNTISFISLNNDKVFIGFYIYGLELEFFSHENIKSDKRYIFRCTTNNIVSYIRYAVNDTPKFIKDYQNEIIDEI